MRLRVMVLSALAAIAVFAFLLVRHETVTPVSATDLRPKNGGDANRRGPGNASDDEIAALRLENRQLRAQLAQYAVTASGQDRDPASSAASEPPTPELEMAWLEARATYYESLLRKQIRNETWAAAIEKQTIEMHQHLPITGVRVVSVQCRSSACRMEFSYADENTRTQHLQSLGELFPEIPLVSYSYPGEPADHTRAVLFLTIRKDPLPPFDYAHFAEEYRTRTN